MTGWRIGFICGNTKAEAYATVKDNTDSDSSELFRKLLKLSAIRK